MAVSQAYFARLLGLEYTTVVPGRTRPVRRRMIEEQGGRCVPFDPPLAVYGHALQLARSARGHYLDHLRRVGGALDWRGPRSLGAEILRDLDGLGAGPPVWVVVGVGSGATSAAVGRHLRERGHKTRLAVVDPENSAYFPGWVSDFPGYSTGMPTRIENIGRPRMEPAFDASVVDLVIPVPDAAGVAAMRHLHAVTGISAGPSSGSCLWGAFHVLDRMRREGGEGPVVMVVGDGGDAYRDTYYDDAWVEAQGWRLDGPLPAVGQGRGRGPRRGQARSEGSTRGTSPVRAATRSSVRGRP